MNIPIYVTDDDNPIIIFFMINPTIKIFFQYKSSPCYHPCLFHVNYMPPVSQKVAFSDQLVLYSSKLFCIYRT